ncbi:Clavaminate synthase-like protein [Cucurbitaria berberidis CBS 394.84]|uniref:Clavaminate synthase-like protein n=1 Tax=Cucurbitaria berberidis CBS 394.84 TaxID=1168544 RepID=A0A9P4GLK0_9PLEO|nr:Clavaminate synthase-like protein [Cucurbitaria berberidis CBS 394.84]KAF1847419.1 Clavaminate synthase-like protein [Cucurbitaria berberidis CBS 394.84]
MNSQSRTVEPAKIPVVDFEKLSGNPEERKVSLQQMDDAFKSFGFIYLSNHTIRQELVDEAFTWSQRFFKLPLETKRLIEHPQSADDHRGWAKVGAGLVSQGVWDPTEIEAMRQTVLPEQKEILEMGNPYSSDDRVANPYPNRLPPDDTFPGFRTFIEKWWDECINQEQLLMRCLCEVVGMKDLDFLSKQQTPGKNRSHMSWLHYLSMPASPLRSRDARRLNIHTDFGQLTLLFQDNIGGLEIHDDSANIFRPVLPKPGTVIVHIGDMLEKQSNGRWKSALHQVTAPPSFLYGDLPMPEDTVVERYAIAFYAHPDYNTMIEPLPGCEKAGKWRSLEWEDSMTAGDWMRKRVALEYEYKPSKV